VVDVVAFAHDIAQGLQPKANEKGLHFLFKPLPDDEDDRSGERRLNPVFYVNVDNDHLREVLANLIENAIKYTPKGDVVIDVGGDSEHVTMSVADSGIGIPKEDQTHLFQKFYRVDNSDTREIGGTGLGLYLCRRLTEAMNGRIWVDSEYKKGSTFYVELPRIDHEEATRLIESADMQPGQPIQTVHIVTPPTPQPLPPSSTTPPIEQTDAVYTNVPVAAVVQQLQSVTTPAPSQLQESAVVQPETFRGTHTNTPLTSIEQDPTQYRRSRPDGVPIPPRNQN
jgi:hypothetical protein